MIPATMPTTSDRTTSPSGNQSGGSRFASAAAMVLDGFRRSIAALVSATPGEIRSAADFHRAIGVDAKLGWQIYRIAHAENDLACSLDVPSAVSMKKLFKAASGKRVPESLINRASQAFEDFESLVKEHAGDRETFASMVSALVGDDESSIDLQHRKAAFAANSHIVGVQAKTRLGCWILTPSKTPRLADFIAIKGLVDLRWLRPDRVPVLLCNELAQDQTGPEAIKNPILPIDRDNNKGVGTSLLTDYCARPLPELEVVKEQNGSISTFLRNHEVGNASSGTYMAGSVCGAPVSPYRDHSPHNFMAYEVRIPCQFVICDLLIHESYILTTPAAAAYSDHEGGKSAFKVAAQMPVVPILQKLVVNYLGNGAEALHTRDVPRYAEMIEDVAKRVGFDLAPLRVYRCRVEYPFMPSSVVMYFEAPEKPEGKR